MKPSEPISGSFELQLDGKQVEIWNGKAKKWDRTIPYNVRNYQIQLAIMKTFRNYEVEAWEDGYPESGKSVFIDFRGAEF